MRIGDFGQSRGLWGRAQHAANVSHEVVVVVDHSGCLV